MGRSRKRGERVIAFREMVSLACLTHWYISMLYVVPVLVVGGWCWWSSKRMSRRSDPPNTTRAA
jgi:hypothetical protein